ncbi:MAG TPA: HAD family hydrolase [Acidimicrobiales bacterium]|nr:HAD family hydrolase [Acidimicrobiales bacterium]
MALEAVTFDHWNTLVVEKGELPGRRLEAWLGIFEDAGFTVEREELSAVFKDAWDRYVTAWTANEQYHAAEAAEQCLEGLGFAVPDDLKPALIDAFTHVGRGIDFDLTEGVAECLTDLKDAGVRLGIICDVGFTPSNVLREHLIRRGLLPLFDHWSFSDEVGCYKPAPEIFEHALDGLGGVEPSRAAHVGDLRRTDIAGALAMGMVAVRYTGVFDDDSSPDPEADHVVGDMRALPGVLGF